MLFLEVIQSLSGPPDQHLWFQDTLLGSESHNLLVPDAYLQHLAMRQKVHILVCCILPFLTADAWGSLSNLVLG